MPEISINNVDLHYEESGTGPQPIVFIHGFLASSNMWRDGYMAKLPDRYRAYAIDMRGHGQSHIVGHGCNLVQLADDVAQFVNCLELGKCIFTGASMGGAVGARLVLDHPEVLRALILINPGLGSTPAGMFRLLLPLVPLLAQKRWLLNRMVRSLLVHPLPADVLKPLLDEGMLVSRETWAEYFHPANRIQDLSRFKTVDVPTLVMIGGRDRALPLDMQHDLADSIPRAKKIVFEDEGHMMVGEIPDRVFDAMMSFLDQVLPN